MRSILSCLGGRIRPASRFGAAAVTCVLAGSVLSACSSGSAALGYCETTAGVAGAGSDASGPAPALHPNTGGPITVGGPERQPATSPAASLPPTSTVTLVTGDRV